VLVRVGPSIHTARVAPAAGIVKAPDPLATVKLAAVPLVVHGPPTSAAPQPPLTVRPKESRTKSTGPGAGAVTVTGFVTRAVAPAPSVTVSVTW
jgi:hypothetical protein